jgi:hypothetical protein
MKKAAMFNDLNIGRRLGTIGACRRSANLPPVRARRADIGLTEGAEVLAEGLG